VPAREMSLAPFMTQPRSHPAVEESETLQQVTQLQTLAAQLQVQVTRLQVAAAKQHVASLQAQVAQVQSLVEAPARPARGEHTRRARDGRVDRMHGGPPLGKRHAALQAEDPSCVLRVSGVDGLVPGCREALARYFSGFGGAARVLPTRRGDGLPPGAAFVVMRSAEDVARCLAKGAQQVVGTVTVTVERLASSAPNQGEDLVPTASASGGANASNDQAQDSGRPKRHGARKSWASKEKAQGEHRARNRGCRDNTRTAAQES